MNDQQAVKVLQYLKDAVELCEKETDSILGVEVSIEISDTAHIFEWNGERFEMTKFSSVPGYMKIERDRLNSTKVVPGFGPPDPRETA